MKKQDKKSLVERLSKSLREAKSVTLVDFTGMNINTQQDLKKKLKEAASKMLVAKNTLIKIAADEAKLPKEITDEAILSGQTAIVTSSDDPVSPIQTLGKFAKENTSLKFKAGVLDGIFQNKESLLAISALPSKEVLVGQTVGSVAGPMYALISNLENKVQEFMAIINAKVK